QAVGSLDLRLGQHSGDLAIGIESIDGLVGHLKRAAIGAVEGISEPDAPLVIDYNIVGAVVSLSFKPVGQDLDLSGLQVGADEPAAAGGAEFGSLATDQPALGIEGVAVGAPAVFAKDRKLAARCHAIHAIADDVAEIQATIGAKGRAFEQAGSRRHGGAELSAN